MSYIVGLFRRFQDQLKWWCNVSCNNTEICETTFVHVYTFASLPAHRVKEAMGEKTYAKWKEKLPWLNKEIIQLTRKKKTVVKESPRS